MEGKCDLDTIYKEAVGLKAAKSAAVFNLIVDPFLANYNFESFKVLKNLKVARLLAPPK